MKELSLGRMAPVAGGGESERSGVERSGTERSDDSPPPARPQTAPLAPTASPEARALSSTTGAKAAPPNPEVLAKPKARRFTAEYKLNLIAEADRCDKPGQIGALLRREGLYTSHLCHWRKQRHAGALGALKGQKRGPKVPAPNPLAKPLAQAQKDNARLEKKLKKAEAIIDFQKKIAAMLNIPMSPFEDEEND